ncbi:hypothetical protein J2X53_004171, partial [Pseudorhodobacter sp. 4114]|nr:hypothetical protein [Pseudorhodobacter sp. 4114]
MNATDKGLRLPRTDLYVNGAWVKASSGKTI